MNSLEPHSFMAYDTLSFVDVRFIAYNKNPGNNNNNKGTHMERASRYKPPMSIPGSLAYVTCTTTKARATDTVSE
jgi:hypothetical protein